MIREPAAPGGRGSRLLRRADETIAVALLRTLAVVARRRPRPAAPRRIGLMKTTGIGDAVLLTAVARDIAAAHPHARLVVVASSENAALARLVEGAEVLEIPPTSPGRALRLLRAARLDVLLDFAQWSRLEALYARLSGAKWTAGFHTPGQRREHAYDATAAHRSDVHELENYRRLAAAFGVMSTSQPSLRSGPAAAERPQGPFTVLHLWPGGFRSELREWPEDRWLELARQLAGRGDAIVLTGAPRDVERTEAFLARCDGLPVTSVAGRSSLDEVVGLLADARCVVSVNTGVMHMAAATGTRTVALNGPTSSLRWGPIGADVHNVDSDLEGCGFLNLGFEYEGRREDCMRGISVERVLSAATGGG